MGKESRLRKQRKEENQQTQADIVRSARNGLILDSAILGTVLLGAAGGYEASLPWLTAGLLGGAATWILFSIPDIRKFVSLKRQERNTTRRTPPGNA